MASGKRKKPRATPAFRLTWILLMKTFTRWKDALFIVKPDTVVRWHRMGFRIFWRCKSRHKGGRPAVSAEMRRLIRKIAVGNPLWSPERIYDQLRSIWASILHHQTPFANICPSRPKTQASHPKMEDFHCQPHGCNLGDGLLCGPHPHIPMALRVHCVSHERRKIIHFGVTKHPAMLWVVQQLREATAFGIQPKYIIRDNDRIYGSGVPTFLRNCGIEEIRTAYHSPWQNPFVERVIGTLRRELLDHIVPLNEYHLNRLLSEYIDKYYHPVRTHSSLDHRPPVADSSDEKPILTPNSELQAEPILGGLYHSYQAKAA